MLTTNNTKTKSPKISIIIAVFNGGKTLSACLDSVINQSYQNKEIIIIDGGSKDNSIDIIRSKSKSITFWESEKDRGIAHAWNKGLKKASGEWIQFLGSDDTLYDSDVLNDVAHQIATSVNCDVVYGQIIFADGQSTGKILGQPFSWQVQKRRMMIPHTGCFHRSQLFTQIGDFDESFKIALDYEILLRKPNINALFLQRLITKMGGTGISSQLIFKSLRENKVAQIKNKVDSLSLIHI